MSTFFQIITPGHQIKRSSHYFELSIGLIPVSPQGEMIIGVK